MKTSSLSMPQGSCQRGKATVSFPLTLDPWRMKMMISPSWMTLISVSAFVVHYPLGLDTPISILVLIIQVYLVLLSPKEHTFAMACCRCGSTEPPLCAMILELQ